jgi:dienelactone hydrolase
MRYIALAVMVLISTVAGASAQTSMMNVDIRAMDGHNLRGTYRSPGASGAAMLLVHQCNMDRHSWDDLASQLVDAGIHVLTFDLRGFGESGAAPAGREARQASRANWPGDVDAAYAYLLDKEGVDGARVAVAGASCGVALAADLATRNPEIQAVVALSGPMSDAGKSHVMATPGLAVFGAAAEDDDLVASAPAAVQAAVEASNNPRSTLKMYAGTEHGTPMFEKNPDLEPALVAWLRTQLRGY